MPSNKTFMTDLGENYEYVRTIIFNNIELAKLDVIEKISSVVSKGVTSIVLILLAFSTFMLFVGAGIIALANALGSMLYALILGGVFMLMLTIIFYAFHSRFIGDRVDNILVETLIDDE